MNELLTDQQVLNRTTAAEWESYETHRRRVTDVVLATAAFRGGRLCVLGAGNCNDLDLVALAGVFNEIHLVDVDGDAVEAALRRQQVAPPMVVVHGGVDVAAGTTWADGMEPLDVVLSAGLLTQLIDSAVKRAHENDAVDLGLAVSAAHVRLLVELVRPEGCGVLVTELVSSDTFPELNEMRADRLGSATLHLIAKRNFFTGTNPFVLTRMVESDPKVAWACVTAPWRWRIGTDRSYLAYAIVFGNSPARPTRPSSRA